MKRIFLVSDTTTEFDLRYTQYLDIESYLIIETNRVFSKHIMRNKKNLFFDEFFLDGEIASIRNRALDLETTWYHPGDDFFRVKGISLPFIDHHAMMWFWQTTLISTHFSEKFQQSDYQILSSHLNNQIPGIYYFACDIFDTIFNSLLKDKYKKILQIEKEIQRKRFIFTKVLLHTLPSICYLILRKSKHFLKDHRTDLQQPSLDEQKEKIVIVLNAGEIYRFQGIIHKLSRAFSGGIILLVFNSSEKEVAQIHKKFQIPCYAIGSNSAIPDPEIISQFKEGVNKSINHISDPTLKQALEAIRYHFDYYCEKRWPDLLHQYSYYLELFESIKPRIVIGSALFDAESQLPILAAKTTNISTLCLPHGGLFYNTVTTNADYICYASLIQKKNFLNAGTDERNLIPCADVNIITEYPCVKTTRTIFNNNNLIALKILVLTELTGHPTQLLRYIRPSFQKQAILDITSIPDDLQNFVDIRLKTHPHIPDAGLFEIAGDRAASLVLPGDTDLNDCLQDCDMIIALNYSGTALIHAINRLKPIIFYWNDRDSYTFDDHYGTPEVLSEAGILCTDKEQLWNYIRNLRSDESIKNVLTQRVKNFKKAYLTQENYPEIDKIVLTILNSSTRNTANIHH